MLQSEKRKGRGCWIPQGSLEGFDQPPCGGGSRARLGRAEGWLGGSVSTPGREDSGK